MKTFEELFAEVSAKASGDPDASNTARLVTSGVHAIGKKIVEEAAEVWMAAEYQSLDETSEEIAQLIYHLQVLMVSKGITLEDIEKHL